MPGHFCLKEFATMDAFIDATAFVMREELERVGAYFRAVMLSGGRTPPLIYKAVLDRPLLASARAYVMFSDERHVAVDSGESNYGSVLYFLKSTNLPDERVLRVDTELPLDEAADHYDVELRSYLALGGGVSRLRLLELARMDIPVHYFLRKTSCGGGENWRLLSRATRGLTAFL